MSSTSSESSSEDEEENKRISQAVIPTDLLSTLTSSMPQPQPQPRSQPDRQNQNEKLAKTKTKSELCDVRNYDVANNAITHGAENSILDTLAKKLKMKSRCKEQVDPNVLKQKSKRPDKIKEDDHSAYHATTPGFRAHIEKRLMNILDSEMESSIRGSVWKKKKVPEGKKQKGIKLFSDVKSLCLGDAEPKHSPDVKAVTTPPKIIPRKRKLNSSSSESSDDEVKINACVFSVDDIMHENKMLESLAKSGIEQSKQENNKDCSNACDTSSNNNEPDNEKETTKDQNKTNNKGSDLNGVLVESESDMGPSKVKKRKKKNKKLPDNSEVKEVTNVADGEVDKPLHEKRKKQKKKKAKHGNGDAS